MPSAAILTLDADLDKSIRSIWQQFEQAAIGKTPGQLDEPPHITFAYSSTCSSERLAETIQEVRMKDTKVALVPFGVFPGKKSVIYFNAILSEDIQHAHSIHYRLCRDKSIGLDSLYGPGEVVFHCTIAVDVVEEHLLQSVKIAMLHPKPCVGKVERLEIWEFYPAKRVHAKEL